MRIVALSSVVAVLVLALAGCGGDNLSLCDGCSTPTPTPSSTTTPAATSSVPIATVVPTVTPVP